MPKQLAHLDQEKLILVARHLQPGALFCPKSLPEDAACWRHEACVDERMVIWWAAVYKSGQTVFRAGDSERSMFFVNRGSVLVVVNRKVVDKFEAGHLFGEVGMILGEKRTVTKNRYSSASQKDCTFAVRDWGVETLQADISASKDGAELLKLDINTFYKVSALLPDFLRALQTALVLASVMYCI